MWLHAWAWAHQPTTLLYVANTKTSRIGDVILESIVVVYSFLKKKSESLQTEGRHFRSIICKLGYV